MSKAIDSSLFPLSSSRLIKGNRRLLRIKIIQILCASQFGEMQWREVFDHIFHREFVFDSPESESQKILKPSEVIELESDGKIQWEEDDIRFASRLLHAIDINKQSLNDYVESVSENWSVERISSLDLMILFLGIIEITLFKEIPPKATLNEAIEIAKALSSTKSTTFINGILDFTNSTYDSLVANKKDEYSTAENFILTIMKSLD